MLFGGSPIRTVDRVPDLMAPIDLTVDIEQLKTAVSNIFQSVGFNEEQAFENPTKQISFNFNHPQTIPPGVKNIHYGALANNEDFIFNKFGLSTNDFCVLDTLAIGTYLEEVYNSIKEWHSKNKAHEGNLNRLHSTILGNGAGYHLHSDNHTTIRYHIALSTNRFTYMMCAKDGDVKVTHIPADGRVWLLDTRILHTALNLAPNRMDKTQRLRNHLIFSVSDQ